MGILCDSQIIDLARHHGLVEPFDETLVNPASIDLRVGTYFRMEMENARRSTDELWTSPYELDTGGGYLLQCGESILLDTLEYVRVPTNVATQLLLKSSAGRNGGDVYNAGYADPGFHGTLTFRYRNEMRRPLLITPGMRLVQLVLWEMSKIPAKPYTMTGRYNGQRGPTPAL
ncbi:MAG: dCTP deaminase [Caldilineaceae bacterium]|nr:dCTP deaminase [Caldilineaceae bacterium]